MAYDGKAQDRGNETEARRAETDQPHVHNEIRDSSIGTSVQIGTLNGPLHLGRDTDPARLRAATPAVVPVAQALLHPYLLGVHRPIKEAEGGLPAYVIREHDHELATRLTASDHSMAVLVGKSCTGKSRAAYEAVRSCYPTWQLAAPTSAESLVALLGSDAITPHTVLWLDNLNLHLLGETGEQAAERLRHLLSEPGPVAVIGTIWPTFWHSIRSAADGQNRHAQARALLRLAAPAIDVPDTFTPTELTHAESLAVSSAPLAAALSAHSGTRRLTQVLAAGPELVTRYHSADDITRAVMTAALETWRLGWTTHLPHEMLRAAAAGYLPADTALPDDWFDQAIAYATEPVLDATAPLTRMRLTGSPPTDAYAVADYLAQEIVLAKPNCLGPKELWDSTLTHAHSADATSLHQLAASAMQRGLYRYALRLCGEAATRGDALAQVQALTLLGHIGEGQLERTTTRQKWLLRLIRAAPSLLYTAGFAAYASRSNLSAGQMTCLTAAFVVVLGEQQYRRHADSRSRRADERSGERQFLTTAAAKMRDGDVEATLALASHHTDRANYGAATACLRRLEVCDFRDRPDNFLPNSSWYPRSAELLSLAGEYDEAERLLRAALEASFPPLAQDMTEFRINCTIALLSVLAAQGRTREMVEVQEQARRELPREAGRYLTDTAATIAAEEARNTGMDDEAELRRGCAIGARWSMQRLLHRLRRTGPAEEFDRVRRFGLEPGGTTAAPWGREELSHEETSAVFDGL
ncbi:hypothetical protein [Streptomyces flavofungini]|uniref:Uncharacterized protein n=1 Tax=Streptomyces flavofungini TaxID=68200 RepID=A0ABS0X7M5_9ACTN|nr:hypothetical protein [Streptomyces flavofungini]MBJ3809204.1 hypothetical protein [Streptomyces flavofungini]GHC69117.1 hypothetical protein GCM10010349_43900 [Streptomyces flavofungini]